MTTLNIKTSKKEELVDLTLEVQKIVEGSGVREGICTIFVPHTTAGVTINENADPSVKRDIIKGLGIIPASGYAHTEGNSPAHIKSFLTGSSLTVLIAERRLLLGRWQGIYFAEFDGPRQRSLWVKLIGA